MHAQANQLQNELLAHQHDDFTTIPVSANHSPPNHLICTLKYYSSIGTVTVVSFLFHKI